MEKENPKVFISYSHDSSEQQDKVLQLSNKLRSEGIDCSLDQYEDSPPEGWPKWMDRQVKNSNFVLVVCTETYYNRAMGTDEKGMGIKWESSLIYQHLYNAGANNTKFIPVIFNDGNFKFIPEPLQAATFYNVDNSNEYEKLYWRLRGVKTAKSELGKLRELPIKERKTFFISRLIDQEKWDKAKWENGVSYLYSSNGDLPPIFTFLFEKLEIGIEIFKDLINKVGTDDRDERIRLSIIEGDLPNMKFGYFVIIGENTDATNKMLEKNYLREEVQYVAIGQRIHRMNPDKNSKNLENFKKQYEKHGCYFIAPAKQLHDPLKGYGAQVEMDCKILKRKIEFRNYKDIPDKNDPDSILKSKDLLSHEF
ncbi:MAG TPA: hypothetical protein DEA97_06830 [Bacteroidales bacterium]|nr:MAG: SEFIR domain-containing protein [candidate division TM6 bacterium GW2011_GWF2_33_332]OFY78389.1 MAG: hypothetical protein A2281_11885 [Bacteroidetes bacterium RIFOXYA12_FULL_38_20]HBS86251.1 hypothetical protein [Bacteroidales bacterium]